MRNLKRALSLALASVMLLGMMVVGAGAASYTDVDENDNVEAIEVLNAVNVMIGRQGNFEPDEPVNRHEMAVIMAKLYLGVDIADNYVGTHPYTDVVPWADKYVAACYENGLTSGVTATTYGGGNPLTAVQAAAMMLRALGYKDLSVGAKDWRAPVTAMANQIRLFQGVASNPSETLNRNQVAQLALNTLKSPMVNTVDGTFDVTSGEGQVIISGGSREYIALSSHEAYAKAINNTERAGTSASGIQGYTVELGEHLYNGKLKLNSNAKDVFGRPSNNWQYDGKDVGTYVNDDLKVAEYKTGVTGAQLYDLLTYTTINDNDLLTWIDGVDSNVSKNSLVRSNKDNVNGSNAGVLTEVFVDLDHKEVTISAINTYLAKANSDYNKTNETLSLKVYETGVSGTTEIVDSKDVPEAADVLKGDYRLVYLSGWDNPTNLEVVDMFDVDILAESTVTKYTKDTGAKVLDKLTTGGTEYKTNPKAFYDNGAVLYEYDEALLTDMTYNIYLDRYGNVIGVDLYEGTKNYVFITGYDRNGSNIAVNTATAAGIFTDGTMDTITVNVTDTNKNIDRYNTKYAFTTANDNLANSYFQRWVAGGLDGDRTLNRWYTYTVSNSGVYTLKPVERSFYTAYPAATDASPKVLNSANLYVDDDRTESYLDPDATTQRERAYGNDNSIYITVSGDEVDTSTGAKDAITEVDGVYTGAQNVKLELTPSHKGVINTTTGKVSEKDAYVYTVYDNKYYIVASIVIGEAQGAQANYAYILSGANNERIEREGSAKAAGDVTYYWEFDAVVNGEKTTLTAKSKYASVFNADDVEKYTVRELRFDGEYVVGVKAPDASDYHINNATQVGIDKADVYDVGNMTGEAAWKTSYIMDSPASDVAVDGNRVDGTIELVGRTLYTERPSDVGLALAADAKAVLIQPENGKRTVTNCGSVSEALGRLADRGANTAAYPTGDPDGIQFKGRVAAVLKDGVAQWVVIISDTNLVTGTGPNYDDKTGQDEFMINNTRVVVKVQGMDVKDVEATIDRTTGEVEIYLPKPLTRITDKEAADALYPSVTVQINNGVELKAEYARSTASYYVYTVENVFVNTEKNNTVVITVKAKSSTTDKPVTPPAEDAVKITDFIITVPTLAKGDKLSDKKATTTNTDVTVDTKWSPADTEAKADTTYTATITVTVKDTKKNTLEGTKITVGTAAPVTVDKASAAKWTTTISLKTPADGSSSGLANAPGAHKVVAEGGAVSIDLLYEGSTDPYADDAAKKTAVAKALGVSEDALVISGNTATYVENGAPKTATINASTQVFKVSLAGSDTALGYIKSGATGDGLKLASTSFTNGATYILGDANGDAQKVSDGAELTVADGKITFTSVTTDVVLYEAVQVTFNSTNDDVKYLLPDSVGVAWAAVTNEDWLPVNSKLQVKGKATDGDGLDGSGNYSAAGKTALVLSDSVNGSPVAVTTGSAAKEFTIDVTKANAKNGVMDVATAMVYEVKNNGSAMGTKTYYATGAKIYVAANTFDSAKKYVGEGTKSTTGITFTTSEETGNQTYTVAAADAVNGVINIKEAVNIQFAPGATFSLSDTIAAVNSAGAASYVAKGSTLYVQAAANNSWIAVKAADAAKVTLGEVVATKKPAYNAKGVWKVTVNDNITADPFEAVLTGATVTPSDDNDNIGKAGQTQPVTLTAKFATAPTTDDVTLATVSGNAIANLTFEFASATTTGLVINLKSGAAAVATSTDPINVTVNGMTVQIKIGA